MDLSKILAISGRPGLYKHIAQSKNSVVVESLENKKRSSAFITEQISSLNDISVFTVGDDIKLEDVFKKIYDYTKGEKAISHNSKPNEIKNFFKKAVPEYDEDRVYISDIKKMIKWYNILNEAEILSFDEEETENKEIKKEESNNNKTE